MFQQVKKGCTPTHAHTLNQKTLLCCSSKGCVPIAFHACTTARRHCGNMSGASMWGGGGLGHLFDQFDRLHPCQILIMFLGCFFFLPFFLSLFTFLPGRGLLHVDTTGLLAASCEFLPHSRALQLSLVCMDLSAEENVRCRSGGLGGEVGGVRKK